MANTSPTPSTRLPEPRPPPIQLPPLHNCIAAPTPRQPRPLFTIMKPTSGNDNIYITNNLASRAAAEPSNIPNDTFNADKAPKDKHIDLETARAAGETIFPKGFTLKLKHNLRTATLNVNALGRCGERLGPGPRS